MPLLIGLMLYGLKWKPMINCLLLSIFNTILSRKEKIRRMIFIYFITFQFSLDYSRSPHLWRSWPKKTLQTSWRPPQSRESAPRRFPLWIISRAIYSIGVQRLCWKGCSVKLSELIWFQRHYNYHSLHFLFIQKVYLVNDCGLEVLPREVYFLNF